jgi:transcriptional regulator with XRE-family HTH domain
MPEIPEIGQRIAYWRKRRGLTRPDFAARVGRSVSWVDKIEAGERPLVRLPMLERVAAALGVEVRVLTDAVASQQATHSMDAAEVTAIREALQSYGAISRVFSSPSPAEPPRLSTLDQQVNYLWVSFQNSHYPILGRGLPRLLRDAQAAVAAHTAEDTDGLQARNLLSLSYQVTASTLYKLGEVDLAWLAAERGLRMAEQTGNDLLISDAARRVAQGLMVTGVPGQALDLLRADIDRLEPGSGTASPEYLSLYGMLFLLGGVAAVRRSDRSLSRDLLSEGAGVADRLGADGNARYTAFGPTNVVLHRVAALTDLHEGGAALEAAGDIDLEGLALLPRERRANFRIDLARAHQQCGQADEATDELCDAYELAPDEVRCRPVSYKLIETLHRTSPAPTLRLRRLASAVGLPV